MSESNEIEQEEQQQPEEATGLSFTDLVGIFFNQGAIALGAAPHPLTGQVIISFEAAQESILILELLQQKTKGNLTEEEAQIIEHLISELKMAFVHAVRDPRIREMAERAQQQQAEEPSRIVTLDGRPASSSEGPRIIIP